MPRKTQRVYASAAFDGATLESAQQSICAALVNLADSSTHEGRMPLFDTLEISVEKETMEERELIGASRVVETFAAILVSAEGVLMPPVSETTNPNNKE